MRALGGFLRRPEIHCAAIVPVADEVLRDQLGMRQPVGGALQRVGIFLLRGDPRAVLDEDQFNYHPLAS